MFILSFVLSGLSDPYEQVGLPVEDIKEGEPVEPYQKIGPSKTSCGCLCVQRMQLCDARQYIVQNRIPSKTKIYILFYTHKQSLFVEINFG